LVCPWLAARQNSAFFLGRFSRANRKTLEKRQKNGLLRDKNVHVEIFIVSYVFLGADAQNDVLFYHRPGLESRRGRINHIFLFRVYYVSLCFRVCRCQN